MQGVSFRFLFDSGDEFSSGGDSRAIRTESHRRYFAEFGSSAHETTEAEQLLSTDCVWNRAAAPQVRKSTPQPETLARNALRDSVQFGCVLQIQ